MPTGILSKLYVETFTQIFIILCCETVVLKVRLGFYHKVPGFVITNMTLRPVGVS